MFTSMTIYTKYLYISLKIVTINIIFTCKLNICPDPDSNWGHEDLQSTALPTELSGLNILYYILLKITILVLLF